MRNLLTYSRFDIEVDCEEEIVRERLSKHIEHFWTNSKVFKKSAAFEGRMTANGFVLEKNPYFRLGALSKQGRGIDAVLFGRFEKLGHKTRIHIFARMSFESVLFFAVFLIAAAAAAVSGAIAGSLIAFLGLFFFIYGYWLMWTGFWSELQSTTDELKRVISEPG